MGGQQGAVTVVVAQPDHAARELLARIVESAGHDAVRLDEAAAPLVVDATVDASALLLIVDVTAMGVDGVCAVVHAFSTRRYPADVVALVDGPASARAARSVGVRCTLERPFRQEDLVRAITALVDGAEPDHASAVAAEEPHLAVRPPAEVEDPAPAEAAVAPAEDEEPSPDDEPVMAVAAEVVDAEVEAEDAEDADAIDAVEDASGAEDGAPAHDDEPGDDAGPEPDFDPVAESTEAEADVEVDVEVEVDVDVFDPNDLVILRPEEIAAELAANGGVVTDVEEEVDDVEEDEPIDGAAEAEAADTDDASRVVEDDADAESDAEIGTDVDSPPNTGAEAVTDDDAEVTGAPDDEIDTVDDESPDKDALTGEGHGFIDILRMGRRL